MPVQRQTVGHLIFFKEYMDSNNIPEAYVFCGAWSLCHAPTLTTVQLHHVITSANGNISALLALCERNPPVISGFPQKGQWGGALIFSLMCAWTKGWINNQGECDLRRHGAHCDVIVKIHWIRTWMNNYIPHFVWKWLLILALNKVMAGLISVYICYSLLYKDLFSFFYIPVQRMVKFPKYGKISVLLI